MDEVNEFRYSLYSEDSILERLGSQTFRYLNAKVDLVLEKISGTRTFFI